MVMLRVHLPGQIMRGSRKFRQGGGGVQVSLTKKALTTLLLFLFFFFFFLVLSLFLRKSNGQFQRNLSFSRFQRGSNIFQGGPTFSRCLFPIETHITCDFLGGVRTPCPPPPSGSALANSITSITIPGPRGRGRPRKSWSECVKGGVSVLKQMSMCAT